MDKDEYKRSSHALKMVLRTIVLNEKGRVNGAFFGVNTMSYYKFVAFYHSQKRMWGIYNRLSENIIATIKYRDSKFYLRYRNNSKYKNVFTNLKDADIKVSSVYLYRAMNRSYGYLINSLVESSRRYYDFNKTIDSTIKLHILEGDRKVTIYNIKTDTPYHEGMLGILELKIEGLLKKNNPAMSVGMSNLETIERHGIFPYVSRYNSDYPSTYKVEKKDVTMKDIKNIFKDLDDKEIEHINNYAYGR